MNDRYLFKAKGYQTDEWYVGLLVYIKDGYCHLRTKSGVRVCWAGTLCQCTGLKDKNGTLIWENDVVRYCDCTEERYVIAWEENKACFEYQQYGCSIMNFDELSAIEVEVVGSIIDNPELLEVK